MRASLATAALTAALIPGAVPADAAAAAPRVPFVITDGYVTIHAVSPPVTVNLRALDDTIRQLDDIARRDNDDAARAAFAALPHDLAVALAWDTVHVLEDAAPPEEDVDNAASRDDEPPNEPGEPERTVRNITGANATAPAPVCSFRYAKDTRTMRGAISRRVKYRFSLEAHWRGCDNGHNDTAEPVFAYYSDVAMGWECVDDGKLPRVDFGPYHAPHIVFAAAGQCFAAVYVGEILGAIELGKRHPSIRNTHDWTGHRVMRSGDAG